MRPGWNIRALLKLLMVATPVVALVFVCVAFWLYGSGAAIRARSLLENDPDLVARFGRAYSVENYYFRGGRVSTVDDDRGEAKLWFRIRSSGRSHLVGVDLKLEHGDWAIITKTFE